MESNKSSLTSGDVLGMGQELKSSNGKYTLRMQEDGNLVVYQQLHANCGNNIPIWESRTNNKGVEPFRLEMQSDNNLCIYGKGKRTWASQTRHGKPGAWVTLQVKKKYNTLIESKMLT